MGEGVARDRDPAGRPRNARRRDELGRPLPRAAGGDADHTEPPALPPREALREAQRLLDAGRPFEAHEVLEAVWKATDTDRDLWRGLAQLGVAVTHRERGNRTGATALFARAAATLEPFTTRTPYGVAVATLRQWALSPAALEPGGAVPPLTQAADDRA